jgi:Fe-S-cluster containining protein
MAPRTRPPHRTRASAARPATGPASAAPPPDQPDQPAGDLSQWLRAMRATLDGRGSNDVPCDGCTACCQSSQFVHIAPDETETLRHIPVALRFPAPFLPAGHVLLGYDEQGRCPMLTERGCSIYEHRPRTCRTYDCRIFAATGVDPGPEKPAIRARVRAWRFTVDASGASEQDALRAAAEFLVRHPEVFGGDDPPGPTQLAVLAVAVADHFLPTGPGGDRRVVTPDVDEVAVTVAARRRTTGP